MPDVRVERTNWRDQELSNRHRNWGWDCPAVDLDFVMVEYNYSIPAAIVEYKHYCAKTPDLNKPTFRALSWLADKSEIPFIVAFYWPEIWAFKIFPVNEKAKTIYHDGVVLTERTYVESMFYIRQQKIGESKQKVLLSLNDIMPSVKDYE